MKDSNCIFCKLANGEIPTTTVYEDDDFRVILDANPATRGHALILPKEHCANIYEISEELAAKAMKLAKKLVTEFTEKLGCDGYNIVQNNGEAAGQTVFHFHMHLIPRYKDDGAAFGWHMSELTDDQKVELLEILK
ncbi:MAG: HIT family protein [Hespellia sp.]|nr:HIT family protein [Hespellia sp.]